MADYGQKHTLGLASDSRKEEADAESALYDSIGQSFFVALCIC